MYIDVGLHVYMATIVNAACWEQQNAFEAQELEVQVAVSHHVSIWNQTLVLCKKTSALSCRAISTAPKMLSLEAVICLRITTVRKSSLKALAALLSLFWAWYVGGHSALCAKGYTWNDIKILRGWNTLSSNGNTVLEGVRTSGIHSLAEEGTVGRAPKWNSCQAHCLLLCFHYTSLQP